MNSNDSMNNVDAEVSTFTVIARPFARISATELATELVDTPEKRVFMTPTTHLYECKDCG